MILTGWKEWTIAGVTAICVYSLYWFGGAWKTGQTLHTEPMTYEMQRVKSSYYGQFDLSNRDIEYKRSVGDVEAVKKSLPASPVTRAPAPQGKAISKKATVAKAKKDPKAELAKKRAELVKQRETERRQRLAIRVVDTGAKATLSGNDPTTHQATTGAGGFFQPAASAATAVQPNNNDQNQNLSPGQWFSLLQAQPSMVNAVKFKYAKADIGDKAYYDIIAKLLKDSQADRQKLALYVLGADTSLGTFQFIATAPADLQSDTNVAAGLAKVQKSYQDKSRFAILAQALNSSNGQVVLASQSAISSSISLITADNTASGNNGNGQRVSTLSKNDFGLFKTILAKLSQSTNAQIAQNAKDIYSKLWQNAPATQVAGN